MVDTYSTCQIHSPTVAQLADLMPEALASFPEQIVSLEKFTDELNSTLLDLLHCVVPLIIKTRGLKYPTPWFSLQICCLSWNDSLMNYQPRFSTARASYFSELINAYKDKFVIDMVAKITPKSAAVVSSPFTAFFFLHKTDCITDEIICSGGSDPFFN